MVIEPGKQTTYYNVTPWWSGNETLVIFMSMHSQIKIIYL